MIFFKMHSVTVTRRNIMYFSFSFMKSAERNIDGEPIGQTILFSPDKRLLNSAHDKVRSLFSHSGSIQYVLCCRYCTVEIKNRMCFVSTTDKLFRSRNQCIVDDLTQLPRE